MAFLILVPITAAIAIKCNKQFEEVVGLSALIVSIGMYVSGLAGKLQGGMDAIGGLTIIGTIYVIYKMIVARKSLISRKYTYGFICFMIFAVYFLCISYHRSFLTVSDFADGGLRLKEIYYRVFLPVNNAIEQPEKIFFPGLYLWEYISIKCWVTFSESIALAARNIFIVIFLIPMMNGITGKENWKRAIAITVIMLYLPLMWNRENYEILSIEIVVATLSVYNIYELWEYVSKRNALHLVSCCCGMFMLCIMDVSGPFIAVGEIALAIVILKKSDKELSPLGVIPLTGILLISAMAACITWWIYSGFSGNISFGVLLSELGKTKWNEMFLEIVTIAIIWEGLSFFDKKWKLTVTCTLFAVLLVSNISLPYNLIFNRPEDKKFWGVDHSKTELIENDNILFIDQSDKNIELKQAQFKYYIYPAESFPQDLNYEKDLSADNLEKVINTGKYDYLYCEQINALSGKKCRELVENNEEIQNGSMYRVINNENGSKKLRLIGR